MFSRLGRSIQNTIVIPAVSLLIVVFLAVLIAYVAVRRRNVLSGAGGRDLHDPLCHPRHRHRHCHDLRL